MKGALGLDSLLVGTVAGVCSTAARAGVARYGWDEAREVAPGKKQTAVRPMNMNRPINRQDAKTPRGRMPPPMQMPMHTSNPPTRSSLWQKWPINSWATPPGRP